MYSKFHPLHLFILFLLFLTALPAASQNDLYLRVKGYYKVEQSVDSVPTITLDGMMEVYYPLGKAGGDKKQKNGRGVFSERKILGERLAKAPGTNSDELFVRMAIPAPELSTLMQSIQGDEYSMRTDGSVYLFDHQCGTMKCDKNMTFLTIDNLAGRENHTLALDELKLYGVVARLTRFEETETYSYQAGGSYPPSTLQKSTKHQTFMARYRGEDEDEQIDISSTFIVTDRQTITKKELKKIKKQKNKAQNFAIPKF